ncbi:MAG: Gfo/Idh/MocA family protein [Puniceicoccaceae bacterium]
MKPLQVGIIGAGHIFWNSHKMNLARMEGVEVAAVCDPSEASQARAVEELGARAYSDIGSMVAAESGLDALLNFSPPFVRKQAIEAAIQLDIPIFVEKPAAGTVREAKEILEILESSPVPVSVGFMWRYMPAANRCLELLDGRKVTHTYSEFFCPAITEWGIADWFFKKEISGGPIVDQAIHLFDLLRYLVGDVESVMSFDANVVRAKDEACTIEDSSSTILKFSSGVAGAHNHFWGHSN